VEAVAVEQGHEGARVDRGLRRAGGTQRRGGDRPVHLDAAARDLLKAWPARGLDVELELRDVGLEL